MIIQVCFKHIRLPAATLLGALLLVLGPVPLLASDVPVRQLRVKNVDWVLDGKEMVISYDLVGDPNKVYLVDVALCRVGDPDFRIVPVRASGDLGEGMFAGAGRSVRWEIQQDLGGLPEGDDFVVEVRVDEADELPWFLVVVGVAVGGATIYSLVQNGQEVAPPPIQELPGPPVRP